MARTSLPPLLRPGLDVVFVGLAPKLGGESLRTGHYYADRNNSFYSDLEATGFTPSRLLSQQDQLLLEHGIGLDDVYDDPDGLRRRIEEVRPLAVCFNSKTALEHFAGRSIPSHVWRGQGAERYG